MVHVETLENNLFRAPRLPLFHRTLLCNTKDHPLSSVLPFRTMDPLPGRTGQRLQGEWTDVAAPGDPTGFPVTRRRRWHCFNVTSQSPEPHTCARQLRHRTRRRANTAREKGPVSCRCCCRQTGGPQNNERSDQPDQQRQNLTRFVHKQFQALNVNAHSVATGATRIRALYWYGCNNNHNIGSMYHSKCSLS